MKKYDTTRQETIIDVMKIIHEEADDTVWLTDYMTVFDRLAMELDRQVFIDSFPEYA